MTCKGIRHLVRLITTAAEGDRDSAAPFSAGAPTSTAPPSPPASSSEAGGRDAVTGEGGAPWPAEMAAPSFMVLSVRPRREET
nr:hypothetical protein OG409_11190 [Streptomyces sp. NBC_00974]